MNKKDRVCSKRTICEVHRQLLDLLVTSLRGKKYKPLVKEATALIEEAFSLGVKITDKLVEYNLEKPDANRLDNVEEVRRLRNLRVKLQSKELKCEKSGTMEKS